MATYNSDKIAAGVTEKLLPSAGGVNSLAIAALTTALLVNDVVNMMKIEAVPGTYSQVGTLTNGPTIIDVVLDTDQLDSNVAPTLTLDVGDQVTGLGASAQRFFAASTLGQAGGFAIPSKPAILGYQPFAGAFNTYTTLSLLRDTIFVTCHAAPATWKNGSIRLLMGYTQDP